MDASLTKPDTQAAPSSKGALWTGRILSGLVILFMLMDGIMKLVKPTVVTESMTKLGYPDSATVPIGIIAADCLPNWPW